MSKLPTLSLTLDHPQCQQFLALLGKLPASACLRGFYPKGDPRLSGAKSDRGRKHSCCDEAVLHRWQEEGRNAFVVVNDGGDTDPSITSCRALFCEWDDQPKAWQLSAWGELGLPEPTFQVDTGGRSIHSYWVFAEPLPVTDWCALQARLLAHTNSDRSLKNPSRVMRLPGCFYLKSGAAPVLTRIVTQAGTRYSVEQLERVLPALPAVGKAAPASTPTTHHPRSLEEIRAALAAIPAAVPGQGQYPYYRDLLWGLIDACRQVGEGPEVAKGLLREHSPLFAQLDQVAASPCGQITAGKFWHLAQQAGWVARRRGRKNETPGCQRLGPSEVRDLLPQRLGQIRLNVRTQAIHLGERVLTGNDPSRLYLELSTPQATWPKNTTCDALEHHASKAPFDPALVDLERLVLGVVPLALDQWGRLDQLLLGIDDPVAAAFLPRYLVSAVARLYQPGCKVDQVPVLIGPQGVNKSELGRLLFGDKHYGDQLSSKLDVDDITRLNRFWCLELAELDGITRRSDLEAFKAFLTRRVDVERRKYARTEDSLPRRTVFWGTSNSSPLRDSTGTRRMVCIPLPDQKLPLAQVAAVRAQIWARAVEQYRAGMQWWSTDAEAVQIKERNADHQQLDPWHDEIENFLATRRHKHATGKGVPGPLHVRMEQLLTHLGLERQQQNSGHSSRIRQIMQALGWHATRLKIGLNRIRCFVPSKTAADSAG